MRVLQYWIAEAADWNPPFHRVRRLGATEVGHVVIHGFAVLFGVFCLKCLIFFVTLHSNTRLSIQRIINVRNSFYTTYYGYANPSFQYISRSYQPNC